MIRSEAQIENFMFDALFDFLKQKIKGDVYKSGCRPLDSRKEDAVVGVSAADAEQIQHGYARVNIYVNDTNNGTGNLIPSKEQITEISLLDTLIVQHLNNKDTDYHWKLRNATGSMKSPSGDQHIVIVNLEFRVITF